MFHCPKHNYKCVNNNSTLYIFNIDKCIIIHQYHNCYSLHSYPIVLLVVAVVSIIGISSISISSLSISISIVGLRFKVKCTSFQLSRNIWNRCDTMMDDAVRCDALDDDCMILECCFCFWFESHENRIATLTKYDQRWHWKWRWASSYEKMNLKILFENALLFGERKNTEYNFNYV